jgi:hypothetical protein
MQQTDDIEFLRTIDQGLREGRSLTSLADELSKDISYVSTKIRKLGYDIAWEKTGRLIPINAPALGDNDAAA